MKQGQGGLRFIGRATITSLLLVRPLAPVIAPTQIFAGELERNPKGKPAAKANFVLTVKDNLLSLKAKDASLKEILEEIGRKMNIEVFALLPEQEKITTEFEKLSLEEAIEKLVRNYPHLIMSQEGDSRITRIIALQRIGNVVPSKLVIRGSEIRMRN